MTIVKIGKKGRHLKLPDGWVVVTAGCVLEGDMFATVCSSTRWRPVDAEDIGELCIEYDCLIREATTQVGGLSTFPAGIATDTRSGRRLGIVSIGGKPGL